MVLRRQYCVYKTCSCSLLRYFGTFTLFHFALDDPEFCDTETNWNRCKLLLLQNQWTYQFLWWFLFLWKWNVDFKKSFSIHHKWTKVGKEIFFPCSIEHTQKGHCSGNYKTMCSDILWICIQIIILLRFHEIFPLFGKLNFVTQIPWNLHGIKILVAISEFFWPQCVPSSESLHIHAPVKSERTTILFEVCQM